MSDNNQKKQVPLRITQTLWNDLNAWADDDFRSINGQIEFLLTECVRARKKSAAKSNIKSAENAGDGNPQ